MKTCKKLHIPWKRNKFSTQILKHPYCLKCNLKDEDDMEIIVTQMSKRKFYRTGVESILLYGSGTWMLKTN